MEQGIVRTGLLLGAISVCCLAANARTTNATLSGVVEDPQGAVITNATAIALLAAPNATIGSTSAGIVTSTLNANRIFQAAGKFYF